MASCRKQLGDARRVEAGLSETEGGAQAGTAGADDDGIIFVILDNWFEHAVGSARQLRHDDSR